MKIFVLPSWYPNFYHTWGNYFQNHSLAAQKAGVEIVTVFPAHYSPKWLIKHPAIKYGHSKTSLQGIPEFLYYLPKTHITPLDTHFNISAGKKVINRAIAETGLPDIVHLQSFGNGDLAIWMQEKFSIPFVLTEHFSGFICDKVHGRKMELAQRVFSKSSSNTAVSTSFARLLQNKFNRSCSVIPNTVDTNIFQPTANKETEGIHFIAIGNLFPGKNYLTLVQAFYQFQLSHQNSHLSIIGRGSEYNKLAALVHHHKIKQKVSILREYLPPSSISRKLNQSTALIISSTIETFGVTAIEAGSIGLPVLTTACGGPEDIITNPKLGIIIENHSASALVQGMHDISEKTWDSQYIRQHTIETYSLHAVGKKLRRVFESVLSS